MMQQSNGLLALVASSAKEKDLPPIPNPADTLLAPKSLNRKNVKKLSFPLQGPAAAADYLGDGARLHELKQRQNKPRARPAPLLNLGNSLNTPQTPTLMDSLKLLDLSDAPHATPRKRQTVISSLSPTKLLYNNSPLELHMSGPRLGQASPLPLTPIATTSLLNLRDEDLVHLKDLGAGNLGVVLKVLHVPLQKTMARKIVHIDLKQAVQTQIIRELRIMHECKLPYIIEFYGAFLRLNNLVVLCMEYCNCGLLDKIVQLCLPRQFPLYTIQKLSFSILSGLAYLYDTHKIIHRDVKPSNVLMTHKGDFRLCDFGVSRELTNSLAMADTFVGTSTYMLPERIQGLTYGVKSDVWLMGLMLLELALGRSVWSDDADEDDKKPAGPEGILDLLQRIVNETSPTLSNKINRYTGQPYDERLCTFVDSCLVKADKNRKLPQELLAHPLLAGVAQGKYDKDVRAWAKTIRKLHKDRGDK